MREIEVKAKINDLALLAASLEKLGLVMSAPIRQKDRIFLPQGTDYGSITSHTNVLRIRDQDGIIKFTLKRHRANELDCIERELAISDGEMMVSILGDLNYYEAVQVVKVRRKCQFQDMKICLDEVEGLGAFIEIEKMSDEEGEKTQRELFDFLKILGVKEEDRVRKGYDTLVIEKIK